MKHKALFDTLNLWPDKELSNSILEYLEFNKEHSIRGIQQSLEELGYVHSLLVTKKLKNSFSSYTEIGSAEGGSLWIYANMLLKPGATINIIEINVRPGLLRTITNLEAKGFKVRLYKQNNERIASDIGSTDALFIDGNHEYIAVKKDFDIYYPIVNKNGLCILHDTTSFPGCIRLKNELAKKLPSVITFSGAKCLHTLLDTFEETQKACIEKGHYDFFYKELETGTTIVFK